MKPSMLAALTCRCSNDKNTRMIRMITVTPSHCPHAHRCHAPCAQTQRAALAAPPPSCAESPSPTTGPGNCAPLDTNCSWTMLCLARSCVPITHTPTANPQRFALRADLASCLPVPLAPALCSSAPHTHTHTLFQMTAARQCYLYLVSQQLAPTTVTHTPDITPPALLLRLEDAPPEEASRPQA